MNNTLAVPMIAAELRQRQRRGLSDLGQSVFDPYGGGGIDWGALIGRGIDVTGAVLSRSPYYSPDDPRYQGGGYPSFPQQPGYYPQQQQAYTLGSVGAGGVTVSPTTILLVGVAAALILFGKRR